jgi:hypothetical protein
MRPSELVRFEHALYCVWSIGVMERAPHLRDQASAFLDECSPQELCGLDELGTWAQYYNDNDFGSSGLDFHDEVWKAGWNLVSKHWAECLNTMPYPGPRDNNHGPVGFFTFFDHTQPYVDMIGDE